MRLLVALPLLLLASSCGDPLLIDAFGDSLTHSGGYFAVFPPAWRVRNHGSGGAKCDLVASTVAATDLGGTDFAVILCGTNDIGKNEWTLDGQMASVREAVRSAAFQGARAVVVTPPPRFLEEPDNERLLLVAAALATLAEEENAVLADAWSAWWQHPDPRSLLGSDGVHPTPEGYAVLGGVIRLAIQTSRGFD